MRTQKNKAVCFTLWSPTHNNPRYADLFPKLASVVQFFKVTLSRHRVVRAMQYRLWTMLARRVIYPAVLRFLSRRYDILFSVDAAQIPAWPRKQSVVVDVDDPVFSPTEVKLLNLPQVKAIIVTTERAKAVFQQLCVVPPIYVIPQGMTMEHINPDRVQQVRKQFRTNGDVVIGYHAPTLTLSCDGPRRAREGLDDLDFLFAALEEARSVEPRITLWLLGQPNESVEQYAVDKPWIKVFGYVSFDDVLNYVSNFDIGVYPRTYTLPPGRFSVKIVQFMACGIPVISTDVEESFIVKEASCGIVCNSQGSFTRALVEAAQSPELRVQLGEGGRKHAEANLDWSILVRRYGSILNAGVA